MLMTLSLFSQIALGLFDSEDDVFPLAGRVTFWVLLIVAVIYIIIRIKKKKKK
jgi:hypothetical protein